MNCEYKGCKKKAKYNLQNWWNLYEINKEKYEQIDDWEGDENSFYCEEHAKKEKII